jgi:hypothetical protein
MAISASQLTSSKTLEEFRQEFNKLVLDVNDIKDNTLFTSDIKFEGSTDDDFETTITVVNPTADRTITLPDESGTMVTTSSTIQSTTSTISANNSANETVFPVFVDGATGSQGLESDTGLTYNPSSGVLTSTTFTGALSGNATTATALADGRTIASTGDVVWTSASFDGSGNVTGTAAIGTGVIINTDIKSDAAIAISKTALVGGTGITLSTNTLSVDAAQTQITSVGALDAGSITSGFGNIDTGASTISTTGLITGGSLKIANAGNIGTVGDTDAIAISSGGVVTFSQRDIHTLGITIADGQEIGTATDADAITIAAAGAVTFSQRSVHGAGITIPNDGQIGSVGDADSLVIDASGNVTASQNLIVTGNLTVNGDTVTNSASNTVIEDTLIELNTGATSNANDMGFIMERGSTGDNAFMGWDESADKFVFGTTTATGANTGNLTIANGTIVAASIEGTLTTAAQANITSVGTLTTLKVADDGTIGSASDADSMAINSSGVVTFSQRDIHSSGITIADAGNIGSASDLDAIAIAADGVVTMNQIPVFSAGINVSGGSIAGTLSTGAQANVTTVGALDGGSITSNFGTINTGSSNITTSGTVQGGVLTGTLSTAAQGNVTSLGTLTGLVIADGGNIGSASDTDAISIAADGKVSLSQDLYLAGDNKELRFYEGANYVGFKSPALSGNQIWVLPAADASSNGDALVSDGSGGLSFSGTVGSNAGTLTLADESSDTETFVTFATAASGNQALKTGTNLTFNSDTGALTASSFVGNVTGNASGTAATVTGAAQTNITSLGTLTALTVDNIAINGTNIGHTSDADAIAIASDGKVTFSQQSIHSLGIVVADAGTIGSASDTDAIAIGADGDVTLTQDLELQHDGAVLSFGGNDEITLTHVHDTGLALKHTATADDKPIVLTLQTGETDIAADDVIGKIDFQAPDEGAGTDAITVAASISAVSEGDFSASNNATKIEFSTGLSEVASAAMSLSSTGELSFPQKEGGDNLLIDQTAAGGTDAGDDVTLNGTDGSSTNANSNIVFEDAVALTTQTDRHIMKRMMGEFNSEQQDLFPNKLRLISSTGAILKTYHTAGDA